MFALVAKTILSKTYLDHSWTTNNGGHKCLRSHSSSFDLSSTIALYVSILWTQIAINYFSSAKSTTFPDITGIFDLNNRAKVISRVQLGKFQLQVVDAN